MQDGGIVVRHERLQSELETWKNKETVLVSVVQFECKQLGGVKNEKKKNTKKI